MSKQTVQTTLLLLGFCLISCSKFPPRKYYYVQKLVTWFEAQQYCREHYTDLATFENMDDINMLEPPFSYSSAWIGLIDDPNSWKNKMGNDSNSWRWSTIQGTSQTSFQMWGNGNPDFAASAEACVDMYNGFWYDVKCDQEKHFTCYYVTDQNVKEYVYIPTPRTWTSAQSYCREHYTDMAKIENEAEHSAVKKITQAYTNTWIGLYRVPWTWSDKNPSLFRRWHPTSLNNYGGNEHCIMADSLNQWGDDKCDSKKVFICHEAIKMTTVVRITTVTDLDLTDPANNALVLQQLDALLRSQGWTDFKLQWKTLPKKVQEK